MQNREEEINALEIKVNKLIQEVDIWKDILRYDISLAICAFPLIES